MARAALTTEPSKVYVGMLIATCAAMLVGIVTMMLEAGDYDWQQKPAATASPALPPPPKADTTAMVPEPVKVAEAPKPLAPSPVKALPVAPAVLPPVALAPVPPPAVEEKKPATPLAEVPSGPIPSPLIIK